MDLLDNLNPKTYVHAHPASGTAWFCDQASSLGLQVRHEQLKYQSLYDHDVFVSHRFWGFTLDGFNQIVALVRDPLRVLSSTEKLYRSQAMKSTVCSRFFGDGLCRGPLWAETVQQEPLKAAMSTLQAWYIKTEKDHRVEGWYRVEDVMKRVDAPSNTKTKKRYNWDDIFEVDPAVARFLKERSVTFGYEEERRWVKPVELNKCGPLHSNLGS